MSPEQARGAEIDGRSDIFSLGGVFYFMLTGRKPFPANDLPTLFHQIQSEDPPPLLGVEAPPELAAVIMKALSKKRETRYQTCQELMADLEIVRQLYPAGGTTHDGRRPRATEGPALRRGRGVPARRPPRPSRRRPTTPSTLCRSRHSTATIP